MEAGDAICRMLGEGGSVIVSVTAIKDIFKS